MTSRRLILGAAVPALVALVAMAIHTSPVRSTVGSWVVTRLQSAAGVHATITRLDYIARRPGRAIIFRSQCWMR